MTTTNFVPGTVVEADWLNDVDAKVYQDTAANIPNVPSGTISSTNVQAAINEIGSDLAASSGSSLVGFIQSGTGAVSTTVENALQFDRISLFEFMTAAQIADYKAGTLGYNLTSAYNAAFANTGREIFLPKGNGRVDSNLVIPVCAKITGESRFGSIITANTGVTNVLTIGDADYLACQHIANFRITGNATANATGILLGTTNNLSNFNSFQDVSIYNFSGTNAVGLNIRNAVTHQFLNCNIQGCYSNVLIQGDTNVPTTLQFVGGSIRTATTAGCRILNSNGVNFYGTVFESNLQEGLYIGGVASNPATRIVIRDCWFEQNYVGQPTKFHMVADGSLSNVSIIADNVYFDNGVGTPQAIKLTGANCVYDLSNIRCYNVVGAIDISNSASGTLSLGFEVSNHVPTMVNDPSWSAVDIDTAGAVWTSYTPTYSSQVGNAATTFSGAVTTTQAKYKRVGHTLHVSIYFSGTLNAVAPTWIGFSLPTNFTSIENTRTAASITNNAVIETGFIQPQISNNVVRFYRNTAAFTASGAVDFSASFTIELAAIR